MIDLQHKKDCTGCNACLDICPKDAINLEIDIEGFWYPKVDKDKCVDCNLCENVCPVIHVEEVKQNEFEKPVCFAAIHKNIEVRFGSTTGGLFSALAEKMYKEGGYVGGAIYDDDFAVSHFISNNPNDILRLRQSKYSQSQTLGIYREVRRLLLDGESVLICGTPCQMAALRRFLKKDYERLIIVDFICKSITSPKFYSKYLDYWERKANSKLLSFKFKDKELGWRQLVKRFDFKNGKTVYSRASENDMYSLSYHHNIVSRPSCYECVFKGDPRISDITIADFWGIEKYDRLRELDDNAGTSAVMINNSKGLSFFNSIKNSVKTLEVDISEIVSGNPAYWKKQSYPNCDRDAFFNDLDIEPVEQVVPRYIPMKSVKDKTMLQKLKIIGKIYLTALTQSRYKPRVFIRFIWLNYFSTRVQTDWLNGGVIYPTPYAVIDLQRNSKVELHGPMIVGKKKIVKSREETRLLLQRNAKLLVEKRFDIVYGSEIEVFENANMKVGSCGTNHGCTIICGKSIELRGSVSIGRDVKIRDTNAHIVAVDGYKVTRPVIIENHTWIGSGACINPGVKVKEGAIVGACSFVVQNVPAHSLVSGHPAKVVLTDIAWKY